MDSSPQAVNVINPTGDVVAIPEEQLEGALSQGYQVAPKAAVDDHFNQEKYGSTGQQAIAGIEGLGQGVAGPIFTGAERALGVKPEDIRGREEANPFTHGTTEVAGFALPALFTAGTSAAARAGLEVPEAVSAASKLAGTFSQAGALSKVGEAAEAVSGLGQAGSSLASHIGANTVKGALEMALFQGGEELNRAFKEEPNALGETAWSNIGASAVLGGVFGGTLGTALSKFAEPAEAGIEAAPKTIESQAPQTFEDAVGQSELSQPQKRGLLEGLKEQKENAPEIIEAAHNIPGATIQPFQTAKSDIVQAGADALLSSQSPTYASVAVKQEALKGWAAAAKNAEEMLSTPETPLTLRQTGEKIGQSIIDKVDAERKIISQGFEELGQTADVIPVRETGLSRISKNIMDIPEVAQGIVNGTATDTASRLAKGVSERLQNVKTLADLDLQIRKLRGELGFAATPSEKRIAAIIREKLDSYYDRIVTEQFTKADRRDLLELRTQSKARHAALMETLGEVSEKAGKKNPAGPAAVVDKIRDMPGEQLAQKLFAKKDSAFLESFSKEWPEESNILKQYQRGQIADKAMKDGVFRPKEAIKAVNALEPEVQKFLFSEPELKQLGRVGTYLDSFPKKFNPSGTEHMHAMHTFFEGPLEAAKANVRDFAISKFIKAATLTPELGQAATLGRATVQGDRAATKAVKAVFGTLKGGLPQVAIPVIGNRDKLAKQLDESAQNPENLMSMSDKIPVPEYAQSMAATAARTVQYLQSLKPVTTKRSPLDSTPMASSIQEARYNKALITAEKPLSVISKIKDGTISHEDIQDLNAMVPSLYSRLRQKLVGELSAHLSKGGTIPYDTRMGLSLFLAQPLDSTMTPQAIMALQQNRGIPAQPQAKAAGKPQRPKGSMNALGQYANLAMTPGQARESAKKQPL